MGNRKIDEKVSNHIHDKADKDRVAVERERFEWERRQRLIAAVFVGTGVYLTVRIGQVSVGNVMDTDRIFAGLWALIRQAQGEPLLPEDENTRALIKADPVAFSLAIFAAGMVLADKDPTDVWDSVVPDSLL